MNFPNVKSLIFIGGGNLMLKTIITARQKGFKVGAILSSRHADEQLESGDSLLKLIEKERYLLLLKVHL